MNQTQNFDQNTIIECFMHIHNPSSTPTLRKQADTFLIDCEKNLLPLLKTLTQIFLNTQNNAQIRLQSLIYLSNVIKRNWSNKRLLKTQSQLPQLKRNIATSLVWALQNCQRIFEKSLFDVVGFIAKIDYPHGFSQFTAYVLSRLSAIQVNEENVRVFKALRDIFLQLAQRKGFANHKNFQEGPLKILHALGPITEGLRIQLCKIQNLNKEMVKLSKYCDQIMIGLLRIAPYSYLDDQNFMVFVSHIFQKLQTLLGAHKQQTKQNKHLLQKDIKSLIYQLGCLQVSNPCIMAPIIHNYISLIFYILPKPQLFTQTQTIKYTLLNLRKLLKQFTYYSQNQIFEKSISSQQKSTNYIQLRNICTEAYKQFITPDTIQGLFKFLISNLMGLKDKHKQEGFVFGIDQGFDRAVEKDMGVHWCAVVLVEVLVQRFNQLMLKLVYQSLQTCIQNNWQNIDNPTLNNFLSVLSILPKNTKKTQTAHLSHFPILQTLSHIHQSQNPKTQLLFPSVISGWLQIFTNEQISQLLQVLLQYITNGARTNNIQILLYSCYSLNRVVLFRTTAVNCAYILNRVFPVAIRVFEVTDNPEVLWPLINLVSSLITKCQFDSQIIVASVEANSLGLLINNQSELLVQALCEMFKSFLCIIPRNKPAVAVFKLVYCFLNAHLGKTQAQYHEKCVNLWYYAIRQFSQLNNCNQEYIQLFETYFRKCMQKIKPILIYILQQYLLLGLIQQKLQKNIQIVLQAYRQAQFMQQNPDQNPQSIEQSTQLKIAALSFQITLITHHDIQKINSQQMLYIIMKDFCKIGTPGQQQTQDKAKISGTLRNSLLSIVNRYVMMYPDYFFQFLQLKLDLFGSNFYMYYFANMDHLTSRTAMKINALALISLLQKVPAQLSATPGQIVACIATMLKHIIPQIQAKQKQLSPIGSNYGKIENSPVMRFSQSILSQRKQKIRKQGTYDNVDIKEYFFNQFPPTLNTLAITLQDMKLAMDRDIGNGWGDRLLDICQ